MVISLLLELTYHVNILIFYVNEKAVSLAMSRDGSSGGVIRLAVITKEGVERIFVPGNKLPTFWEG
jgi:20S proteasome alpha/beta subunit